MSKNLTNKFKKIKLLATDFDGVMTDGFVYVDQNGKETVRCSRRDGFGIFMLQKIGVEVCVISKEVVGVAVKRCEKLKIDCYHKAENGKEKLAILEKVVKEKGISLDEVVYIGDDLNDLAVLEVVGLPISVADGHNLVKQKAQYITLAKGGDHAIREVCEKILSAKEINLNNL